MTGWTPAAVTTLVAAICSGIASVVAAWKANGAAQKVQAHTVAVQAALVELGNARAQSEVAKIPPVGR